MKIAIETVFWGGLLLIVHSYLIYPLSLMLLSAVNKRYVLKDRSAEPKREISILISAYNEERMIGKRIAELLAIDYSPFEIIVGIDGATDRTYEILKQFNDTRLRVFPFDENRGKVWVLNDICKQARGEILIFSDANTQLHKDSLKKLERHFSDPRVGGVCGRLELDPTEGARASALESEYWGIESRIKRLEGDMGMTLGANGAIYAIRRELFVPFATGSRIADDFILPLRIIEKGYYFVYESEALAYEQSGDVRIEFNRKVRIGAAIVATLKASGALLNPLRGFVAYAFWSHKVLRWLVPYLLIVIILANVPLMQNSPFFLVTAVLQGVFYIGAVIGILGLLLGIQIPILSYLGYFVAANAALIVGLGKSFLKEQDTKWKVARD